MYGLRYVLVNLILHPSDTCSSTLTLIITVKKLSMKKRKESKPRRKISFELIKLTTKFYLGKISETS